MSSLAASATADIKQADIDVPSPQSSPTRRIKGDELRSLALRLSNLFDQYRGNRVYAEQRWLRNQRQYLGVYDDEIQKQLTPARSQAFPKLTRIKCISVGARLMNLMFPGNENNWELKASPSPDMKPEDVKAAIATMQEKDQDAGVTDRKIDIPYVMSAVQTLADERAKGLSTLIDDQLQELGGDQTYDYIALNREVVRSSVMYGLGVLRGPFARKVKATVWKVGDDGTPTPTTRDVYKPMFEILSVWDFYPDMAAKKFANMDGYFVRVVMSRSQVRELCDREDFFEDVIRKYLSSHGQGNYQIQTFETELRAMGVKINVNEKKMDGQKYEILVWNGPISGLALQEAGVEIDDDKLADDIDAEVWMLDGNIIKCDMNPWRKLGVNVKMIHPFLFDEDDTSPIGQGLPNIMRDSQLSVCAATRMLLDNGSVVCGPNLEVNTDLMRADQDLSTIVANKVWYREGTGVDAQYPAVREVKIDGHISELIEIVKLFMEFADAETFVGPATGGDIAKAPSEPMRTAAGASMMRGDAALPFKDIVRSFDKFTQSVIQSLVQFNKKFNEDQAPEGDYNVIARGATSLIAKEMRGMQVDQLATTQTDDEKLLIDQKKLTKARLQTRDLGDLLLSDADIDRAQKQQAQTAAQMQQSQQDLAEANLRKLLSDAYKNVAQGQKNTATAEATTVKAALETLEQALHEKLSGTSTAAEPDQPIVPQPGDGGGAGAPQPVPLPIGPGPGQAPGLPIGPGPGIPG